ncbi:MAG: phytanoyl-CoA dioxygenase family protein [Anditalea sp.]
MSYHINKEQIIFFEENGYLVVENLLTDLELDYYQRLYDDFLNNRIDASRFRSDLGIHVTDTSKESKERITQIMVPSRIMPELLAGALHRKTLSISKQLLGQDMELDFDMLINKAPKTDTPTPWHQDCSYWINLPDVRASSCWIALDEALLENGCMWYIPGSHKLPMRKHKPAGKGGGALECDASEEEGVFVEIQPGTGIFHHGATVHYSRGNATDSNRRAFITNFRPKDMIKYERDRGYDHTGNRDVKNDATKP